MKSVSNSEPAFQHQDLPPSLTPLIGGRRAFDTILERIREARREIDIRMFIWRDDSLGNTIGQELLKAADRGVSIRVRKDLLGSIHERAEENGRSFFPHRQPPHLWLLTQFMKWFYFRSAKRDGTPPDNCTRRRFLGHPRVKADFQRRLWDHSKCYVIDREIVILGGMNIEEKLVSGDVHGNQWRDYMLQIRSADLAEAFLEGRPVEVSVAGRSVKLVFHPGERYASESMVRDEVTRLIREARRELLIEMAYFGDHVITDELVAAGSRGVRIKIVSSAKANVQPSLNLTTLRKISRLTGGKAEVYLSPKMIHSKLMMVDDRYVCLGSGNFNRSSLKCGEVGVVLGLTKDDPLFELFRSSFREVMSESRKLKSVLDSRFRRLVSATEQMLSSARF